MLALVLIAGGCIWIVLAPTTSQDNVAAFGLLGVIVASLARTA